jgi:hypothetical protein
MPLVLMNQEAIVEPVNAQQEVTILTQLCVHHLVIKVTTTLGQHTMTMETTKHG